MAFSIRGSITSMGTATPSHRASDTFRLSTPMSRPLPSSSGPPSDPGFVAAVVSITSPR